MNFIADLHIHSRFSLATSKELSVASLASWAALKGIRVLGTADFTHPAWRAELRRDLVFDENAGLYRPKTGAGDAAGNSPVFFCPQTEISCIYRRGGRVRKVHNLVFMPTLEAADEFSKKLGAAGNINSDGRPILGLDSRDLLEMVLECSPDAVLIPAHIWTPWFSLFGSRSGFDSIEECYGDLTPHLFALETGLSSDPEMNRCLSALDKYALISNSDAHSGANLGREANIFAGAPSYAGIFAALRKSARRESQDGEACRFLGTLEFHPEEGKYHLDGHRECDVRLSPAESRELGNICPKCGKPLTIGVLHRVMELADRFEAPKLPLEPESKLLVPLAEIVAEILRVGSGSRKVREKYLDAIRRLGPELEILANLPLADIDRYWEPLGEAVRRLRANDVIMSSGYDGRFGTIRLFEPAEIAEFFSRSIFPGAAVAPPKYKRRSFQPLRAVSGGASEPGKRVFSDEQLAVINAGDEPLMVVAGPGAGKTACLVERVARLIDRGASPDEIRIVTFTRRAAGELKERLAARLGAGACPAADTLHGLAFAVYKREIGSAPRILNEVASFRAFASANPGKKPKALRALWKNVGKKRETLAPMTNEEREALDLYKEWLKAKDYCDYAGLLERARENAFLFRGKFSRLLVDEVQDLSLSQLEVLRLLLPENGEGFFGIGDPDQAVYAFRGACPDIMTELKKGWPGLRILHLSASYRSAQNILDMGRAILGSRALGAPMKATGPGRAELKLFAAANEFSEAAWIADKIKALLGSTSHTLKDREDGGAAAPADIAVLTRRKSQIKLIGEALDKIGAPWTAAADDFYHDENCANFIEYARSSGAVGHPRDVLKDAPIDGRELLEESASFRELCRVWEENGDWDNFFGELAWMSEAERIDQKAGKIKIITLHSAKGLEFEKVFIPGLESAGVEKGGEEENKQERNLLYVGVTRASNAVYMSYRDTDGDTGKKTSLGPALDRLKAWCDASRDVRRSGKVVRSLNLFGDED
ncbi:MAG: UvrD-helicase domain-containing protein [Desulfovibrio sp.]|nr:UvrD-helicase domain-containing protein [Desulfovibrio sp.]